jgi:hypothetical protein
MSAAVIMMQDGGMAIDTTKLERQNLQTVVARKTLKYCPFVNSREEMSSRSVFAQITMSFLGIGNDRDEDGKKEERITYWGKHDNHAYHSLNAKRCNININVGRIFKGM